MSGLSVLKVLATVVVPVLEVQLKLLEHFIIHRPTLACVRLLASYVLNKVHLKPISP